MSVPAQKRVTGQLCCVPGCRSRQLDTPKKSFYRFPNRDWEVKRKQLWIARVRRQSYNLTDVYYTLIRIGQNPWVPSKYTTICSAHFVGGVKSSDPRKENYNPTIFPWKPGTSVAAARRERLAFRNTKKNEEQMERNADDVPMDLEEASLSPPLQIRKETCEISVQTDDIVFEEDHDVAVLYCSQEILRNEISTQTNIPVHNSSSSRVKVVEVQVPLQKSSRTIAVGTDLELRKGVFGFDDIKNNEKAVKQLCGISLAIFYILLKFVKPGAAGQPKFYRVPNDANRLLLFLMKMKLGLPFTALSCIFKIGKQTASDIFYETLETLYISTKSWIFWPSNEAVKDLLPSSLKLCPNCRAIIDCTELHCETPPTVKQRVLMYSAYKSSFTVKYLIAITPNEFISFISKGYSGRTSDCSVVNSSGFLDLVEPGDEIMADKGFPQIRSELVKRKSVLVMPPFAFDPQFTREQVLEGYSIASVRIHVERAIQRIRIFKVLDYIPIKAMPWVDKIVYISCVLANNKEPLIKE